MRPEAVPTVRIPPPHPTPLSKPDIIFDVLTPTRVEQLPEDFVYVYMDWDAFLDLASYMTEIKFKFREYNGIIQYWEEGNDTEQEKD